MYTVFTLMGDGCVSLEESLSNQPAILFDLDNTLVLTDAVLHLRNQRAWSEVYRNLHLTTLPPGTREFLRSAARFGLLGVVTNSPRAYATRLLTYHRLRIPVLVAYHDVTRRKPHPEPLLRALEQLNVVPQRCVYIGDEITDIQAAEAAGVRALGISWNGSLSKVVPDRRCPVCENWEQVLRILADWASDWEAYSE